MATKANKTFTVQINLTQKEMEDCTRNMLDCLADTYDFEQKFLPGAKELLSDPEFATLITDRLSYHITDLFKSGDMDDGMYNGKIGRKLYRLLKKQITDAKAKATEEQKALAEQRLSGKRVAIEVPAVDMDEVIHLLARRGVPFKQA